MYQNIYNVPAGFILADQNFSPAFESPEFPAKGQAYPKLQQWSDVTFLEWQNQAASNVGGLKNILRSNIINLDTRNMMDTALQMMTPPQAIGFWGSQVTFEMTSDQGKALLGTPNGGGVAWILINHKAQLGIKTISSVTIWKTTEIAQLENGETGPGYEMLFTFA